MIESGKRRLSSQEEKILIEKIIKGDQKATRDFWKIYKPPLKKFVSLRVDSPEDIDDIVQDTLTDALLALPRFSFKSRLFTWICGIARHEIADFYRKKKIKIILFSRFPFLETLAHHSLGPEGKALESELKQQIKEVLNQLSEGYRQILQLKYIEELTLKQIASLLKITPKAVESKLTRARKAFRRAWQRRKI